MKKILLSLFVLLVTTAALAQKYPEPEFTKEVYYLKKDSVHSVMRLEKGSSKMETKAKMGGMGGSESAYVLEEGRSAVRISNGSRLSFVFSNGASTGSSASNNQRDSMMRANGMDPSAMQGMSDMGGINDPASTIVLYKLETGGNKRKVLLQKNPGMMPFGSKKQQSSDKYSFSIKKIRDGYWELVIDKTLPRGEYAFTLQGMGMGSMDGSTTMFAFGID